MQMHKAPHPEMTLHLPAYYVPSLSELAKIWHEQTDKKIKVALLQGKGV
jgi:hypothetical protein